MIRLITSSQAERHRELLEKVYRFRHRFFVDRLGWEALRKPDGREIDQFDAVPCIHIVNVEDGEIAGYARLLPSMGPHLLRDVYPEILGGGEGPRAPDIWEWTRFCVSPDRREGPRGSDKSTGRMYAAVVETGLYLGITAFLNQFHPIYITRVLELGFDAQPLALPTTYAGEPVVAMCSGISETTLSTIRAVFGLEGPVLRSRMLASITPERTGIPSPLHDAA
jgi:acyl-homoserine lactone synthase